MSDTDQSRQPALRPGATVRIVQRHGRPVIWQAVDPKTGEVVATNADEQLLRAEIHARGWMAEDAKHL